jgi:uncharacterized protein (TIGR03435 family)
MRPLRTTIIALAAVVCCGQSFEVATVKVAAPAAGGGRASASGDRISYRNTTLLNVLRRAFDLKHFSQVAGPSWVFTERYDIVAKAPDNTPKEQISLMLRALLVQRFKLVLHRETRELPMYALLVGKGPLKMRQLPDEAGDKNSFAFDGGLRRARSMSMGGLAQFVSQILRRPVVDMTGLPGYYDFPLGLSLEERGGLSADAGEPQSSPSIFVTIDKLGLKLDSRKAPLSVIVIDDGIKVPIEN